MGNEVVNAIDYIGLWKRAICCTEKQKQKLKKAEESAWGVAMSVRRLLKNKYTEGQVLDEFKDVIKYPYNFSSTYRYWYAGTLSTFSKINDGFKSNSYSVKCLSSDGDPYVRKSLDKIIRFPKNRIDSGGIGLTEDFLHEMSHLYAGTSDLGLGSGPPFDKLFNDAHWIDDFVLSPEARLTREIKNIVNSRGKKKD